MERTKEKRELSVSTLLSDKLSSEPDKDGQKVSTQNGFGRLKLKKMNEGTVFYLSQIKVSNEFHKLTDLKFSAYKMKKYF